MGETNAICTDLFIEMRKISITELNSMHVNCLNQCVSDPNHQNRDQLNPLVSSQHNLQMRKEIVDLEPKNTTIGMKSIDWKNQLTRQISSRSDR